MFFKDIGLMFVLHVLLMRWLHEDVAHDVCVFMFLCDVYDDVVWRCLIDDVKQWCFLQMCVLFDAYYDEFFDDAF